MLRARCASAPSGTLRGGAFRNNNDGGSMAIASKQRDTEATRAGFERWLTKREGPCSVAKLSAPTSGLSSDTFFASVERDGVIDERVLRLPPAGDGLFPEYDFAKQAQVQQVLGELAFPVASPVIHEPATEWLGSPFLVMPRVAGRVLTANPSYLTGGWLVDAPSALQRRLIDGFLTTLAQLHRFEIEQFEFLAPSGGTGLAGEFARWSAYLDWASGDVAPPDYLTSALNWCSKNRVDDEPRTAVCWGDVQLANVVFAEDASVAAVVDWEMCGLGPPEMDLGWFLALHGMTVATHGGDLPGFGTRASMIATYEAALGREVDDLRWYEAFALVRSGSIMVRIARLLAAQGVDDSWLTKGNPTQAALDALPT